MRARARARAPSRKFHSERIQPRKKPTLKLAVSSVYFNAFSLSLSLSFFLCLADALVRVTLLVAHGQEDEEAEEMPEKHRVTIKSNYNLSRRCVRFDRDFDRISLSRLADFKRSNDVNCESARFARLS